MDGQQRDIYFHTDHTATLLRVSKKTIYRWRKLGLLQYKKDGMSGECLHSLESINEIRQKKFLSILSYNDVIELLKENSNVEIELRRHSLFW